MPGARSILRLDSRAGLVVGLVTLLAHRWLAGLYAIPARWIVLIAAANLLYGTYSGWLASALAARGTASRRAVDALIAGNLAWGVVCVLLLATLGASATVFAWLHLVTEGVVVVGLALAEWRWVRPASTLSRVDADTAGSARPCDNGRLVG